MENYKKCLIKFYPQEKCWYIDEHPAILSTKGNLNSTVSYPNVDKAKGAIDESYERIK